MCMYCEWDYEDGCRAFYHIVNHHVWIDIDTHELVTQHLGKYSRVKINNCPMCGRNFKEEGNGKSN